MIRRSKSKKAISEGMKFPKNFRYWPILVIVSSIMLLLVTFRMAPKSSSTAIVLGGDMPVSGNSFKSPQSPDEMLVRRFGKRKVSRSNEEYDYDESTKQPERGRSGSGIPRIRSRTRRRAMKRLRSKGPPVTAAVLESQMVSNMVSTTEEPSADIQSESQGPEETTIYDLEDATTQASIPNYDHMGMFPVYPFF